MQINVIDEFSFKLIIQTVRDLTQIQKDAGIDNSVNMTNQDRQNYINELNNLCNQLGLFPFK